MPVGCVPSAAVAAGGEGEVSAQGVSARRGVCPGGCLLGEGVYPSMHWADTPSVNRMTDTEV